MVDKDVSALLQRTLTPFFYTNFYIKLETEPLEKVKSLFCVFIGLIRMRSRSTARVLLAVIWSGW